jgi:hypothetical protein
MQVALELSPSFPLARPSAVRTLLYPQGSAYTFLSLRSEVCTSVHGVYTTHGTRLLVS